MSGKILYFLIAAFVLVGVGFYLYDAGHKPALAPAITTNTETAKPLDNSNTPANPATPAGSSSTNTAPTNATTQNDALHYSNETDINGDSTTTIHAVDINGPIYTPASLTVKVGDVVVFRNKGDAGMRIKSDTYTDLDSGDPNGPDGPVDPGQLFQFKFTKVGKWKYYNALVETTNVGTITVTK